MNMIMIIALALLASTAFDIQSSKAASLIQNGGFETGNLAGWTPSIPNIDRAVVPYAAHTGNYGFGFNTTNYYGISQNVATTPGDSYTLSLWVWGGYSHIVDIKWDNTIIDHDDTLHSWENLSFVVSGTGSDTVGIFGVEYYGYASLDDVSLIATSSSVPEPSSFGLMFLGLTGVGFLVGRRRLLIRADEQG